MSENDITEEKRLRSINRFLVMADRALEARDYVGCVFAVHDALVNADRREREDGQLHDVTIFAGVSPYTRQLFESDWPGHSPERWTRGSYGARHLAIRTAAAVGTDGVPAGAGIQADAPKGQITCVGHGGNPWTQTSEDLSE